MLEEDEEARLVATVLLVDQHAAATKKVAVALQRQVDHRVEQRVARTDERRQGLAERGDEVLLEGDPLVAAEHGLASADQSVAAPHAPRYVSDLVPTGLALAHGATEPTERLRKNDSM